ncbi:MAG: WD40/YVTN/BNR-like repeat-containing protein, partial [Dehalococcoidia bacterium]
PLTVHPVDPDVALAGSNIWEWTFHYDPFPSSTSGEGIYKTVDGGGSWSKATQGFIDVDVVALAVDPNDPNVVYVGMECSRGIFRTDDGGASWVFISGGPEGGSSDIAHYTMRLATDSNSNVYLTGRFGFTRSDDRGRSWIPMLVRRHFHGVGISPHDPRIIFVGTSPRQDPTETNAYLGGRILRSRDGGLSWQEERTGFPDGADTSIHDFAFDAIDPNVIYVTTSSHEIGLPRTSATVGIYKSTDGGETWTSANNGLTTLEVDSIVASPTITGLFYAGTERGVFRSSDAGDSWSPTSLTRAVRSLLIDPTNTDTIFAGTEVGLFWSPDGGATWERLDSVPAKSVTGLATDSQGRLLYAAVNDVGIFKGMRK